MECLKCIYLFELLINPQVQSASLQDLVDRCRVRLEFQPLVNRLRLRFPSWTTIWIYEGPPGGDIAAYST
jgi:hypothetical protein